MSRITLCALACLLLPASALAWPDSGQWAPIPQGAGYLEDEGQDQPGLEGENAWDLVGVDPNYAAYWYLDESYLYLRMRLNDDPSGTTIPYTGAWGLLVESDGDDADFEHSISLAGLGSQIVVQENSDDGEGVDESAETAVTSWSDPFTTDLAQLSERDITYGVNADFLLDLALPLEDLDSYAIIEPSTIFQLCVATSADSNYLILDTDTAGHMDNVGLGDLPDCLSEPISIDGDQDGLSWFQEVDEHGTDPTDADSDDDGLDDGDELALQDVTGCPDMLDDDSDGDGLLDGEEVNEHGSDPCVQDSDGDGLADYDEVDFGTSPTEQDSDGDGFSDLEEYDCVAGAESDPDDRDGDGIEDAMEGGSDADDDGDPNWCDTDADGDGTLDAKEGQGDDDCDEIPNWLDEDDSDGECPETGDPDTDTDTDTDTDSDADSEARCDSGVQFCGGKLTGGGCSSLPRSALALPALLAALLLATGRRRRGGLAGLGLLAALALQPGPARAQGLDAQNFTPAIDGDRLLALDDATFSDPDALPFGGGLLFGYAADPVVYRLDGSGEEQAVVESLGTLDALLFFRPATRLRLGMDLPLNPVVSGPGVSGGHLLGDIALDTRITILDRRDGLGVSASARVNLPTGQRQAWVGEGTVTARALLGASTTLGFGRRSEALVLAANAGLATGSGSQELRDVYDLNWGLRLPFGVGASYAFAEPVWASAELTGSWLPTNPGQPGALPLEALLGLRLRPASDLLLTLGGGLPLSSGIGTPDLRGIAGLSWVPAPAAHKTRLAFGQAAEEDKAPIPPGEARLAVQAQQVRGAGEDPLPLQAWVTVLGSIQEMDQRNYTVAREPRSARCEGDGRVELLLPPGEYTVRVLDASHQPISRELTLSAGHETALDLELEPVDSPRFRVGPTGGVELLRPEVSLPLGEDGRPVLSAKDAEYLRDLGGWIASQLPGNFVAINGYASADELSAETRTALLRGSEVKLALDLPPALSACAKAWGATRGETRRAQEQYTAEILVTDLQCPDFAPPPAGPARE